MIRSFLNLSSTNSLNPPSYTLALSYPTGFLGFKCLWGKAKGKSYFLATLFQSSSKFSNLIISIFGSTLPFICKNS